VNARQLLDRAEDVLVESPSVDHWQAGRERLEAEDLLEFVLGEFPDDLDDEVTAPARRRFERLVARRATGEPVPLITGTFEFRGLRMKVRPGVFVPRDSSEWLVEQAVSRLRRRAKPVVVDLATGAGPMALAMANELPRAEVYGTDLTAEAVALARENARRLKIPARFVQGDLFSGLPRRLAGRLDMITFHPPYLGRREIRDLPDEIRHFEPISALTDQSPTGMFLIERAAEESEDWLRPGGWIHVEVSPDRSRQVAALLRRSAFRDVRSTKDPAGGLLADASRVIVGRR
jgi:release factor glutamine methyltransferase